MYHIDDPQNYRRVQNACRLLRKLFYLAWFNVLLDVSEHKFVVYHHNREYMSSEYLDDIYKTLAKDVLDSLRIGGALMTSQEEWLKVVFFLDIDNVDNPFIPLLKWLTEQEVYKMQWFNISEYNYTTLLSNIDEYFYADKEFYFVP